jgi:hypothetical protein
VRPREWIVPMRTESLTHLSQAVLQLSDAALDRQFTLVVGRERGATAEVLVHMAEYDARRRYVPAGYPSLLAYCVEALRLSEDAALRRNRAARAARQYPALLFMLDDGQLNLTGISLLAPHLTPENADELMATATHLRKSEIERLIAQHFPHRKLPVILRPLHDDVDFAKLEPVPGRLDTLAPNIAAGPSPTPAQAPDLEMAPATEVPECFWVQFKIDKNAQQELRYAQSLLSHALPSGDVAQVFLRALRMYIKHLEKRKFGASSKPRAGHRAAKSKRCIPAHVRHAVWERDQGQCTFVGDGGHRCGSRKFLEFDHVEPVARGGEATVAGVRLRCHAHNQYEAERVFGAGFMHEKRERARGAAVSPRERDVIAGLRHPGLGLKEAQHAAEASRTPDATLEEHMRAALRFVCPKATRLSFSAAST